MNYTNLKTIYLIRHGETFRNKNGEGPAVLTPAGQERVQNIPAYFKNKKISKIYSSTMSRAIDSVKPLEKKYKKQVILNSVFCEIKGSIVGHKVRPIEPIKIIKDYFRLRKAKQVIENLESKSIVVCHGNFIRGISALLLKLKIKSFCNFIIPNCSVVELQLTQYGWQVKSITTISE